MSPRTTVLNGLIAATAVGAIAGALLGGPWLWLHYACKPLATASILALAIGAASPVSSRYRMLVCAGLMFSLVGDVFLMLPGDSFLAGLVAFLVAHLFYLVAFYGRSHARVRLTSVSMFAAFGVVNLIGLLPIVDAAMRVPVVLYVLALLLMAGFALARARSLHALEGMGSAIATSARLAAIGALFFVISDTLLAWNRFDGGIYLAPLWVLGTYFVAQWYIARSVELQAGTN